MGLSFSLAAAADEYALRRLHAALRAVIGGNPEDARAAGWLVEFQADPPPDFVTELNPATGKPRPTAPIERMRRMATDPALRPWYPSPADVAAALTERQPRETPRTSQKAVDLGAAH